MPFDPSNLEIVMKKTQAGFTLIELMIVVAIIAILAAIALPAYQDYTIRAQISECGILGGGAKTAVSETFQNTGTFPATNVLAGLAPAISGKYVSSVAVSAGGVVTCTFSSAAPFRANAVINAATVVLTPASAVGQGSVDWTCASALPPQYLATACRAGTN